MKSRSGASVDSGDMRSYMYGIIIIWIVLSLPCISLLYIIHSVLLSTVPISSLG